MDQSIKKFVGVYFDVLVKMDRFILLIDFVVQYYEMDQEVPIILFQPFISISRAIVDLDLGEMRFNVHYSEVSF